MHRFGQRVKEEIGLTVMVESAFDTWYLNMDFETLHDEILELPRLILRHTTKCHP